MATVYVTNFGLDSRTYGQAQVPTTPWLTTDKAVSGSTTNDTVSMGSGTFLATTAGSVYAQDYHNFTTRGLVVSAGSTGATTLNAVSANYVGRISASLPNSSVLTFNGIVFDGRGTTDAAFNVGDMATNNWTVTWNDCTFAGATGRTLLMGGCRIGTFTLNRCKFTGSPSIASYGGSNSTLASAGTFTAVFNDCVIDTKNASGNVYNIHQDVTVAPVNTVNYIVDGLSGTAEATTNSALCIAVYLRAGSPIIRNCRSLYVRAADTNVAGCIGINIVGTSTSTVTNPLISNNHIHIYSPTGYGIALGSASAESYVTGGSVINNKVTGRFYSAVPHNISLGQNTTGSATGNLSVDGYVGLLTSKTTTANISQNVTMDCYGPNYYVKGVTAATIDSNIAICTGKYVQSGNPIFHVTSQGGVDCTAATISNNLVIVNDITKIRGLAGIGYLSGSTSTYQPATYTSNTYIVPDTVDVDTALLFSYGGTEGQSIMNQTLAQWLTNPGVTGDKIIKLPQTAINNLINGGVLGYWTPSTAWANTLFPISSGDPTSHTSITRTPHFEEYVLGKNG